MKQPPKWAECYVLTKDEAETLAERLRAKGYNAERTFTGSVRVPGVEHIHPSAVQVLLTPEQADRLAR